MNERKLKLNTDNPYVERELRFFCLQYGYKKAKAESYLGLKAVNMNGMPSGGDVSNPTAQAAEKREKYVRDCFLIEQSAREATADCRLLYRPLLKLVTTETPQSRIEFYTGKNQVTKLKKKFYNILGQKLEKL